MKTIPLTQGKIAIIDDCDFDAVSRHYWFARKTGAIYYACRFEMIAGKPKTFYMHREILQANKGEWVDHKNGEGLDNRRENIRKCSIVENCRSFRRLRQGKPQFRGVTMKRKLFRARITVNKREISLGSFRSAEEAALAYDIAAVKYFGRFAHLNLAHTPKEFTRFEQGCKPEEKTEPQPNGRYRSYHHNDD